MYRSIKTLFNFDLPATEPQVRDASLHCVGKLVGLSLISTANDAGFEKPLNKPGLVPV